MGGSKMNYSTPISIFPVFHRRGSLLPLNITKKNMIKNAFGAGKNVFGLGDASCDDSLTLLLLHPKPLQSEQINIRGWKEDSQEVSYKFVQNLLEFTISPHKRNLIFCIKGISSPTHIFLQTDIDNKTPLTLCADCSLSKLRDSKFSYTFIDDALWIRIPGSKLENGSILSLLNTQNTFKNF